MKKLFTLVALLTCFLGVKAEEVVDLDLDLTTVTADNWQHGWVSEEAAAYLSFDSDGLHFTNEEAKSQRYEIQFQPFPGIQNLDNDASYTISITIKGSVEGGVDAYFSGSNTPGTMNVTTEWQTLTFEDCKNNPNAEYFANSASVLIQCGDFVGDWWISHVKITHDEKAPTRPVEWLEQLTNGNAESAWPAWTLEETDGVNINWRGDRTGEICAWSLLMGTNNDSGMRDGSELDGRARPFPATIVADPDNASNHVFMVDASQIEKIDDDNSIQWSNEFWIQSPKGWKEGTKVKLHFRYKAEVPAKAATQIHKQNPSDYLHYVGIGDVNFTETWQDFDKEFTFDASQATGWSVAFNLCADSKVDAPQPANKFYFDDLSWQVMKLDEGYFVASSNSTTGIEYDYDNAIEFVAGEDPDGGECLVATVGTAGKEDTWVNQLMISTVRGETASFKGATIKPTGNIKGNDKDNWQIYAAGSQYKIDLPAAGVWQIFIAPEESQILFMMVEGEEIVEKEPIDIVTNQTAVVVHGQERDWRGTDNDGNPIEEEVGEGQPWDNQFFIFANRTLAKGTETVLKFKYKASVEARTTTQCHGAPGAYMHWEAIHDVIFTEDWLDFEYDFTVPNEADGMQCIAFNMAEIKEACDYELTDFQWYLKDETLEEGKTYENLINETGADNFYVKEGAGTAPRIFGTDPEEDGISSVVAKSNVSTATFNLAGQRVANQYKGIVVKNGRKSINK